MDQFKVSHVGASAAGWTVINGDGWQCEDWPPVGPALQITAGGEVVAEFAPGKWSAICTETSNPPTGLAPPPSYLPQPGRHG